jgi:hypothetical protein
VRVRKTDPAAVLKSRGGRRAEQSADGPTTADWLPAGAYEVEVATERFPASASSRAPYDPTNARIRA